MAQPDTMVKDAVRLKGEIITEAAITGNKLSYSFKVIAVVKYGATFSSPEPKVGEEVILYTSQKVRFKKGNEVILDATTDQGKNAGLITINMITD